MRQLMPGWSADRLSDKRRNAGDKPAPPCLFRPYSNNHREVHSRLRESQTPGAGDIHGPRMVRPNQPIHRASWTRATARQSACQADGDSQAAPIRRCPPRSPVFSCARHSIGCARSRTAGIWVWEPSDKIDSRRTPQLSCRPNDSRRYPSRYSSTPVRALAREPPAGHPARCRNTAPVAVARRGDAPRRVPARFRQLHVPAAGRSPARRSRMRSACGIMPGVHHGDADTHPVSQRAKAVALRDHRMLPLGSE